MRFEDKSFFDILESFLQTNQLQAAILLCQEKLNIIPVSPFHKILDKDLLKSKKSLATWLMNFYLEASYKLKKIEAIC
jgi:hypothetical protein